MYANGILCCNDNRHFLGEQLIVTYPDFQLDKDHFIRIKVVLLQCIKNSDPENN